MGVRKERPLGPVVLERATQWLAAALSTAHHGGVFAGAPAGRISPRCAGRHRSLPHAAGAAPRVAGNSISAVPTIRSMAKTLTATMRAVAVTPKTPGSARQV